MDAATGPRHAPGDTVWLHDVSLMATEPQIAAYRQALSPDEVQRAKRLITAELSRRFVVGRGVLRSLLASYLKCPAAQIRFATGPHGKPRLADDHAGGWEFNVSHTGDFALIAVTRGRAVGVDVECHRHRLKRDELAARFFSTAERQSYFELPEPLRLAAFYRIWTCKEAYLKVIGAGLSFPLGQFAVSVHPDQPPGVLHVDEQPDEPRRWAFVMPAVDPDHSAALAVEGHGWTLRRQIWDHGVATGIR